MVALRPDEWKPICSSASSTATRACLDSAAAADSPAIPPPMTRMSGLLTGSDGAEPLVHDLAALGQADALYDLIVVRKQWATLLLVPECREEIVEVAREQRGGIGGERAREICSADDRHPVFRDGLAAKGAFDIAAGFRREVDDHASGPHRRELRSGDEPRRRPPGDQRGGDHIVLLGDVGGHQLCLGLLIFRRHFRGVAARTLALDAGDILDADRL